LSNIETTKKKLIALQSQGYEFLNELNSLKDKGFKLFDEIGKVQNEMVNTSCPTVSESLHERIFLPNALSVDFGAEQDRPDFTTADVTSLTQSIGGSYWYEGNLDALSVKTIDGLKALEAEHVPTPNGNTQGTEIIFFGVDLIPDWPTRMTLAQCIYLPDGFDFAPRAGATAKLGFGIRSRALSTGAGASPEGFSSRSIYRLASGVPFWGGYTYSGTGTSFSDQMTNVQVVTGEWIEFAQEIVMNSAYGVADGSLKIFIDGNLELAVNNINWIQQQRVGDPVVPSIAGLSFDSFHGGSNDPLYSPATTQYPSYGQVRLEYS